jgi:hypothetical protein
MIVLALPCVGLTYTTSRIVHRTGLGAWRWSDGHPGRRVPLLVGSVASLAIVAMLWWPRGDYRPITRDERGTVLTGLSSLPQVARERIRVSPPKADTEPEGDGARTTTTESGVTTTTPTTTQTVPATETVPTTTEPLPAEDPAAPVDPAAPAPADPTLTETVPVAP